MKDFLDFILVLFKNLFTTTDLFILVWAIFTLVIIFFTNKKEKDVENILNQKRRVASKNTISIITPNLAKLEDALQPKIVGLNKSYTWASNFISAFPLLGMLGTVKSLIGLASGMTDQSNTLEISMFFSALTSTAWGMIFAIIFKIGTSSIFAKIETDNKEYEIISTRVSNTEVE